jgi:DNA-binding beta-propeller fold protein YncE
MAIAMLSWPVVSGTLPLAAESSGPSVSRVVLGGSGGWDYLAIDSARHHLFITRGDRVQVFDTETLAVVAEIPGTDGVHGVALASERNIALTSNGASNSVSMFDLASLHKVGQITGVGKGPDAIVYDRRSSLAFTFNGGSHDATVIDVDTARIVATIALPGRPEFAATDEQGHVFVNIEDRDSIARIDIRTLEVTARWPLPGCDEPTGLAIDAARGRLFVSCGNQTLMVVDATSGSIVARMPIGAGSDAVAFDAQRSLVLSSNRDGTLSVIRQDDPDHYSLQTPIPTRFGARTLALDTSSGRVFLVTSDFEPESPAASSVGRRRRTPTPGSFSVLWVDLSRAGWETKR